jgi:hypothetical protein
MPTPKRRITEKRGRSYRGEDRAGALVRWLNCSPDEQGKERIKRVIALYRELRLHALSTNTAKCKWTGGKWVIRETPETRKGDALRAALDEVLQYCQTMPSVIFEITSDARDYKYTLYVASVPVAGTAFDRHMKTAARIPVELETIVKSALPGGEAQAIELTLELLRTGGISSIHQCRRGTFVFQRFSHQRFCSQRCRIAEYRASDEFRVARNSRQRELYHLHKNPNIR